MKASDLLKFFEGDWKLDRNILSQNSKENLQIQGEARFRYITPNCLKYEERCEVTFNLVSQDPMASYRSYFYEYDPESGKCFKYFDDRRLFYELIMQDHKIIGLHKCVNDNYKASYDISSKQAFSLRYKVSGPNKNLDIFTEYNKVS